MWPGRRRWCARAGGGERDAGGRGGEGDGEVRYGMEEATEAYVHSVDWVDRPCGLIVASARELLFPRSSSETRAPGGAVRFRVSDLRCRIRR